MNYSENENDRKEVEDDEIEELPESSVDFKAGIVETGFEQPCAIIRVRSGQCKGIFVKG